MEKLDMGDYVPEDQRDPSVAFNRYVEDLGLSSEDLKGSVLDVGAGSGVFAQYLRETLGNKNAYGAEIYLPKIKAEGMVVADGYKLPFEDNEFDLVISKDFLPMFVSDHGGYDVLNELIRVTKPDGTIRSTITTPQVELETAKEYKGIAPNIWLKERIIGAGKLESYLNYLDEKGFDIQYGKGPKDKNFVVMKKPA